MHLEETTEGDILIIKPLAKRLDASASEDFGRKMKAFIDKGNALIVLDMSEIHYIDSSGLGAVISIVKKLGKMGELVICGMNLPVSSLFHMTRMDRVVKTFSKRKEAITELSAGSDGKNTVYKRITLSIDSDLENVALMGMVINKLCSLMPISEMESYQIELCVVEAVNNSIEHSYKMEKGHEVEVIYTQYSDRIMIDVCDTGEPMDPKYLKQEDIFPLQVDSNDLDSLAEQGRGLPIIKEIMDAVAYKTERGKNRLTLVKSIYNPN